MTESHREFADKRVMIICAPNGARRTSKDHPGRDLAPISGTLSGRAGSPPAHIAALRSYRIRLADGLWIEKAFHAAPSQLQPPHADLDHRAHGWAITD